MEVTLDKFGRILIPKKIRKQLNLEVGAEFEIVVKDGRIVLMPLGGGAELILRDGVVVYSITPRSDIDNVVEQDRDERIDKFIADF